MRPAPVASIPSFLCPGPHQAPAHLRAECRLFVEIAVHEFTVLPSGDLTAGGQGVCQGPEYPCPPGLEPMPGNKAVPVCRDPGSGESTLCPAPPQVAPGQPPGVGGAQEALGRAPAGSPALGADAAGTALDLAVHVQEARAVTLGLLRADLWGHRPGGPVWQGPLPVLPRPLSAPILTGHLVMSSGQIWAPLEAGSSQVLEPEVRGAQ